MFHGIQQLILVYEMTNHEIGQSTQQHLPGVSENAVDQADDEDENCLRQEETVAKHWGLDEFCVVWKRLSDDVNKDNSQRTSRGLGSHKINGI